MGGPLDTVRFMFLKSIQDRVMTRNDPHASLQIQLSLVFLCVLFKKCAVNLLGVCCILQ